MFCTKCGNQVPDGMQFCNKCGTPIGPQAKPQPGQPQPQQPMMGALAPKPPKKPMSKNTKMWIGIAAGAVVLIAVALVLVFTLGGDGGGAAGPLSGNTTQTKFVNDAVKAVGGAFEDVGMDTLEKMMDGPFDIEAKLDVGYGKQEIALAYDKLALGVSMPGMTLLLDEDKLYLDQGNVVEMDIGADGLNKRMTLEERFGVLVEAIADGEQLDIKKLVEMLVNSISEEHFEKDGDTAKLTLDFDAILETLQTFGEKLGEDEAMEDALKELIGMKPSDLLQIAVPMLEQSKSYAEFELEIEIGYTGGKPTSLEVKFDMVADDYSDFEAKFEHEKQGNTTTAKLDATVSGEYTLSGDFEIETTRDGAEYELKVTDYWDEKYEIKGSEEWKGEEVKGELQESRNGEVLGKIEYELTLRFDMPEDPVADDKRFEIDTQDAYKIDMTEAMEQMGINFGIGF